MNPRRQATADRKWFRVRQTDGDGEASARAQTASADQPAAYQGQAEDSGGRRGGPSMPLAAPTPTAAAADAETSATTAGAADAGAAPDANASMAEAVSESAGAVPADISNPPADAPTLSRGAQSGFSRRRGTARTRAAHVDLAARGSAIAPRPEVSATEPAWRQTSDESSTGEHVPAALRAAVPEDVVSAEAAPGDEVPADAGPPVDAQADAAAASAAPDDVAAPDEVPQERVPPDAVPADAVPADAAQNDEIPADAVPAEAVPADAVPAATALSDDASAQAPPPDDVPAARAVRERPVSLSARLMALARMIQIGSARSGRDGFGSRLLVDAEDVLAKAGERMRLSSAHTVVVLAGGTGSGKSSLFNRLAGAEFSTVGVTRPVTRNAHACVWGSEQGAGAILEWLKVPGRHRYARSSALDSGEEHLAGLVLLDLPDHDSVMSHAGEQVDRLVGMADVMIWVLDPQKYADAAVHRRFLMPMAGHSAVVAVVLNQIDLLDPAQVDDCVADLRRLLDSENLHDVPIVVTSAVTGAGLDDLRALLGRGVAARRAAMVRISADLDDVVTEFLPFAGDMATEPAAAEADGISAQMLADRASRGVAASGSSGAYGEAEARGRIAAFSAGADVVADVPAVARRRLTERLAAAAGVAAIGETLRSARELRALDFVGWPVAWFVQRLTGLNSARKARIGALRNDLRAVTAGPAGAQQAEIDNALSELSAELARPLPKPWSVTIRNAARSRAEQLPAAIGRAIGEALPPDDDVVWWWRLAGLWQGLLLGTAAVAIAWILLIAMVGILSAQTSMPGLMSDPGAVPWLIGVAIVALALGALTTSLCMRVIRAAAERENVEVTADMQAHIAAVAQEMVIAEAEQELSEFLRYREEARIAAGGMEHVPAI
jgi:50S ribosome-binding GTPase